MLKLGRKDPKQGRSKDTVEAIFGAVTHILNDSGVEGLTTNKIAEVAGVSVGSLYQYFKNKESIYEGILLRLTENNLKNIETILLSTPPEDLDIRKVVTVILKSQLETFQKMDRVSTVLFEYAPKVLSIEHLHKIDERMIRFLTDQVNKHGISIRPQNAENAFFICSQSVRSVMLMSFVRKKPEDRENIINELIDMLSTYLEVRR